MAKEDGCHTIPAGPASSHEGHEAREEYVRGLAFLSETALRFVELSPEEDIYSFVGGQLARLVGEAIVIVNSFDASSNSTVVRAILGVGDHWQAVFQMLGRDPVGARFTVTEEAKRELARGELVRVPGGLHELSFGEIPRALCHGMEKLLGIDSICSMGFVRKGELLGNVVIVTRRGAGLRNPALIETLVNQTAVALQRRRAEEALRESEERFRRLAENAPDVVFRFELFPSRGFGYVSPRITEMVGYTPEEFYADPDIGWKLMHPDDLPIFEALVRDPIEKAVVIRWLHKDGYVIWTEQHRAPVHDETGRVVAVEGIVRDITERKQMEQRLLRAERLETAGRIAGQVAHDFNNLLSPLIAYPELVRMELPEGHPASGYCDVMMDAARRMAEINSDLLALGRRGHIEQTPTDLNLVVRQAVAQLVDLPDTLRQELRLDPDLRPVRGSHAQLLRVISNLLSNAREAMQDDGVFTLWTENVCLDEPLGGYSRVDAGEYVRLSVADTGCGIPLEVKDRIFDPYFTTKTTDQRRGSGLGLSVVQAIVEDHRGYLELESEEGKGSCFSIYLPACREAVKEPAVELLMGGTESVLVVDDDPLQRGVLSQMLERLGYRAEVVADGEEAVAHLAVQPADLLILDMVMPQGIDGAESYRRVLELRPGQRAIILSGFAESGRVREAQARGAGRYLRKPVTLEALARAVREELDRPRTSS